MFKAFDLTGKVIVVVGGNKGIGRGISEALIEAGATVVIGGRNDINNRKAACELGCDHDAIDAIDGESVRRFMDGVVAKYNRLDGCFVTVGGPTISTVPFDLTSDDYWDTDIERNLKSVYLCYREAGRNMIALGNGGSLVSISSVCAVSAISAVSAYATAKAGLIGLTNSITKKFGEFNIRVNTIMAGIILTEATSNNMSKDVQESLSKRTVFNRMGKVEDFGGLAIYLASDASSWHTGDTILLDGGTSKTIL
jgi:NAD(P)-dependent dehydrogenase (short-subunit alcohol dehydrogenase family)